MATSSGLFLATIYNQSQLAERNRALLVDQHCGNGCSIKRAPLSVSYYNAISGGHIWRGLYGGGVLPAQYCPCAFVAVIELISIQLILVLVSLKVW